MPQAVEVEMHIAFGWEMVDRADLLDSLDLGLDTAHIVFYSLHLCQYEAEVLKKKTAKKIVLPYQFLISQLCQIV